MPNEATRRGLEQLHRWRQSAAWAPIVWLPAMIYGLSTQRLALAMALGVAGLSFALLARAVVWSQRCPQCGEHFGASDRGFERIWQESGCHACGVSLYELRRKAV